MIATKVTINILTILFPITSDLEALLVTNSCRCTVGDLRGTPHLPTIEHFLGRMQYLQKLDVADPVNQIFNLYRRPKNLESSLEQL